MKVSAHIWFHLPFNIETEYGATLDNIVGKDLDYDFVIHPPAPFGEKQVSWRLDPAKGRVPDKVFADVIEIDLVREVENPSPEECQPSFDNRGLAILERFLTVCRARTRQVEILHPLVGNVISESLGEDSSGKHLWNEPGITVGPISPVGQMLTKPIWEEISLDVVTNRNPELWEEFLLNATASADMPRRCIVEAAIGAELLIKGYVREVGVKKDPVYQYLLDTRTSIEDYLNQILPTLGFDLESLNKPAFDGLIHLFRTRNSIAHKGLCEYHSTIDGKLIEVDYAEATKLVARTWEFADLIMANQQAMVHPVPSGVHHAS